MDKEYHVRLFNLYDGCRSLYRDTFNVTEKDLEEVKKHLIDWYNSQPHFPKDAYAWSMMETYYLSSKCSLERAKQKMRNNLMARTTFSDFFKNRDPQDPKLLNAMDYLQWTLYPKLTPEGNRIFLMRFLNSNTDQFDPIICFKLSFMIAELRMNYDYCLGDLYIWDLENFNFGHAIKMTPTILKKSLYLAQECYGSRIKGIHIINFSKHAQTLLNAVKVVLKKKIAERIFIHNSLEELHKMIPPENLPKDLGGFAYTCEELNDLGKKLMQTDEWRKWYKECETKTIDESKMPESDKSVVGDSIGIVGSFRKLDID